MHHIVSFSGGVASWMTAKRLKAEVGTENMTLLFADTKEEDPDLYRFLREGAANIGAPLVRIADGRRPWEVMRDERFIGNSAADPCSKILKRQLMDRWRAENFDPEHSSIHVGIDWSEEHRFLAFRERMKPWTTRAILCEPPYITKKDMFRQLEAEGIERPLLYKLGFQHNNCGGFCVKAGQAQFALLYRTFPERYAYHEQQEQELRELVGDYSILRDRRKGAKSTVLTLKDFRERISAGELWDNDEWGGCGCAID